MNSSLGMGMGMGGGGIHHAQHGGGQHSMAAGGAGQLEDGDNRTRNAKAQRRHREKRKAHLKAVGLSVPSVSASTC
jgi:hypothetical protein